MAKEKAGASKGPGPFPIHPHSSTPADVPSSSGVRRGTGHLGLSKGHNPPSPTYRLAIALGGKWSKLTGPAGPASKWREGRRGTVRTFSQRSRSRLIQAICKIDQAALPPGALFVTLTYPGTYSPDADAWHRDLETWGKRLSRRYPDAFFFWKLEFQARGAPHFHLLAWGIPSDQAYLPQLRQWVSRSWYGVVGSGDRRHLAAGTNVQPVRSWRQLMAYTSKYVGKVDDNERATDTGRIWGIFNRRAYPTRVQAVVVSEREFFALRRIYRRFMGASRGFFRAGGPRSGIWVALSSGTALRCLDNVVATGHGAVELMPGAWLLETKWGCP